jgi:hypothetical protein
LIVTDEANFFSCVGVNGFYPPDVIHDVVHNRTANIRGGAGHNVGLDWVNEMKVKNFKGIFF